MTQPASDPPAARIAAVVEHVDRYGLTTVAALARGPLRGPSRAAAARAAARYCVSGLLHAWPLDPPARYYVLGREGRRAAGRAASAPTPLGPQATVTRYAVLAHCVLGAQPRQRLRPAEAVASCPWLPARIGRATLCAATAPPVLELVRVDAGAPADHVARKVRSVISLLRPIRGFREACRAGAFRLVLVTPSEGKAEFLRDALRRAEAAPGVPVHFTIVPRLLRLTPRRR